MNLNIFNKEEKKEETFMYTEEQLMARLKFFIGATDDSPYRRVTAQYAADILPLAMFFA